MSIGLPTGKYQITRHNSGEYVDGRYVKAGIEQFDIDASIQPLTGNDLKIVLERRRTEESNTVFTETKLRVADEKNNLPADELLYDGKKFEILNVRNWSSGTDIPHYECIAVKINGEGGGNVN